MLLKRGKCRVRELKRAQMFLTFNDNKALAEISEIVGVSPVTARRMAQRYNEEGLKAASGEKPLPVRRERRTANSRVKSQLLSAAVRRKVITAGHWNCCVNMP